MIRLCMTTLSILKNQILPRNVDFFCKIIRMAMLQDCRHVVGIGKDL